ncbi:uncharacterized protein TNCV_1529551 [Trichonephila clavipes]|uniref:Mutator-like transposase domain-containing protein n=1 Tax=Trichonephila clavipes TaxID=2585209 RepID=A0A8X6SRP2_TRICX|nr:uncharacterized protein TNCV_1529551 [Trichonephila clavipes]
MDISEHNSNVAQHSSGDSIFKNERVYMQEKSVLEQENVADTYDEPSETTAEYDVWYSGHKNSCQIDHVGTSGAMEMKAAAKIWSRSEACGFRYTTLLSDGDAKTHKFLNSLKIYGPDVEILLASDSLLKGCARFLTQNSNESLHSVIWSKCSKETSVKSRRVNIAVSEAVSGYNFGTLKALKEIQKAANLDLGEEAVKIAATRDYRSKKERNRQNRFGNKNMLLNTHLNNLLNLTIVRNPTDSVGLRNLFDRAETQIRSPESFGVKGGSYSNLLTPIMLKQLPSELVLDFNHSQRDEGFDLSTLLRFLHFEISSRERASEINNHKPCHYSPPPQDRTKNKGSYFRGQHMKPPPNRVHF